MNARILPVLLALVLLGCPPAGPADFRTLAEKAYPADGTQDGQALDKLWTALFKLPQWHLVMTEQTAALKQPSVEVIGGESYFLVFTDLQMLRSYALWKRDQANAPANDGGAPQLVFAVAATSPDGGLAPPPPSPYFDAAGNPLFVSMTPDAARAFMEGYKGAPVANVRFNEGARKGWFAPVKAVSTIHSMLKANGKL
jgi:hypothetical protein